MKFKNKIEFNKIKKLKNIYFFKRGSFKSFICIFNYLFCKTDNLNWFNYVFTLTYPSDKIFDYPLLEQFITFILSLVKSKKFLPNRLWVINTLPLIQIIQSYNNIFICVFIFILKIYTQSFINFENEQMLLDMIFFYF